MAYSRHTWVSNDTIDAAKLNNIEMGVEAALASGQYKFATGRGTAQSSDFSSYTPDTQTYYRARININFGKTFNEIPSLTVSAATSIPCRVNAGYQDLSKTGFTLVIERANNTDSTGYSWQAIGT